MTAPLHVVGAAILRGGRCLAARRGPGMGLAGKWEFPGGKVEEGEEPRAALRREIAEELGVEIDVGKRLGRGRVVAGPRRQVVLDVYQARLTGDDRVRPREHAQWGWFDAEGLAGLDWAEADLEPLRAVLRRLRDG